MSFVANLNLESYRGVIRGNIVPGGYVNILQKPPQFIPCQLYTPHLTLLALNLGSFLLVIP